MTRSAKKIGCIVAFSLYWTYVRAKKQETKKTALAKLNAHKKTCAECKK